MLLHDDVYKHGFFKILIKILCEHLFLVMPMAGFCSLTC